VLAGFNSGSAGPGCGSAACSKYIHVISVCLENERNFLRFFENIILIYECTRRDNKNKEKTGRQQVDVESGRKW